MSEPPQSWGTPPPPHQPSWQHPAAEPSPQPYRPPPGSQQYGPAPTSRSKLPWILGAAGVILVLVAVGLVLLIRGGGSDSGDPESAAASFVAAAKDGDCDAFTALTSQHFQDTYGRCEGDVDTAGVLGASGVTIDGDVSITDQSDGAATAEVDVSAAGFTVPMQLQMVRDGERWLVDDLTIAGFGLDDLPNIGPPPA